MRFQVEKEHNRGRKAHSKIKSVYKVTCTSHVLFVHIYRGRIPKLRCLPITGWPPRSSSRLSMDNNVGRTTGQLKVVRRRRVLNSHSQHLTQGSGVLPAAFCKHLVCQRYILNMTSVSGRDESFKWLFEVVSIAGAFRRVGVA